MGRPKVIFIIILNFIFMMNLKAQLEIGGLIDFNIASIQVKPVASGEDYSSYLGIGIGVVVDYSLNDQIDLHIEPMFLQKGARIEISQGVAIFKVHYLEIPILLRYTFDANGDLLPYAMAGPSLGLLSNAKYDFKDGGEQNEKDATRLLDLGMGIGGGIKVPKENKTFFAELRYVLGLVNINKEANESSVNNRGIQIVVGVTIPLGLN